MAGYDAIFECQLPGGRVVVLEPWLDQLVLIEPGPLWSRRSQHDPAHPEECSELVGLLRLVTIMDDMLPPRDPNDDDDENEEDEGDEDEEEPAVIREPDE